MISGIPKSIAMTSLAWLALPSLAAQPDPAALVAKLERQPPARTAYTEVRFSGLFERPLILHGELEYLGPGRLGKTVTSPYTETMRVSDGQGEVTRGRGETRHFALGQAPELEGFLRGFTALLGGDAEALARDFELAASGTPGQWRLVLTPNDARLKRRVTAIEVDGDASGPRCFRTREADGDINVLLVETLADTKLAPRVSPMVVDGICRSANAP
jgi:hypothetical protein